MKFSSIPELIADIKLGKMVILVDDESRENEGDFAMAASHVTASDIAFMAEQARTVITLALTQERCRQIGLKPQGRPGETAFTQTIEAATGVSTGSSATDRVQTIKAAIKPDALPRDIKVPGHVFPLQAVPGGVLHRAGHTESICDLAKLAGLEPAGLLSEIMLPSGEMARLNDLELIAEKFSMKIGTIADLIEYRTIAESLVTLNKTETITLHKQQFNFNIWQDTLVGGKHYSFHLGDLTQHSSVPVRVQRFSMEKDFLLAEQQASWNFPLAIEYVKNHGAGVVVLLDSQSEKTQDSWYGDEQQNRVSDRRILGLGSKILAELGVTKMDVMAKPSPYPSLSGFGLELASFIEYAKVNV